jgi:hypothetical protein
MIVSLKLISVSIDGRGRCQDAKFFLKISSHDVATTANVGCRPDKNETKRANDCFTKLNLGVN